MLFTLFLLLSADLTVNVTNLQSGRGQLRCALFSSESGFPMDAAQARRTALPAQAGALQCKFDNLSAGDYAVAVNHDLNDNGKTGTNFLGIPSEPWGVSNNARPRMRAPKFAEAKFTIRDGESARLDIKLEK
jgi:uncharacterized protein (DUF2141 family)